MQIKTKSSLFLSFFLILFFPIQSANAASDAQPELNIVIDSSGSMRDLIGSKTKMQIAKDAVISLLDSLPEDARIGLRVYGTRGTEDIKNCSDSILLVPISISNKNEIRDEISKLAPTGWTPIEYALRQAYNDFTSKNAERIIVIVSDGEESCGGDPCRAARELKEKGIKFTINTIGFNVTESAQSQLACMAQVTEGTYHNARNPEELNLGLYKATQKLRDFTGYTTYGEHIKGGSGFENSVRVYIDKQYILDILPEETLFFYLNISDHKIIDELSVTGKGNNNCFTTLNLGTYGLSRKRITSESFGLEGNDIKTASITQRTQFFIPFYQKKHDGIYITLNSEINEQASKIKNCNKLLNLTIKIKSGQEENNGTSLQREKSGQDSTKIDINNIKDSDKFSKFAIYGLIAAGIVIMLLVITIIIIKKK